MGLEERQSVSIPCAKAVLLPRIGGSVWSCSKPTLPEKTFLFFFNFLFLIAVKPINNVVIVSGGQQSNSASHMHISVLPHTLLPSRLAHNVKQLSLC